MDTLSLRVAAIEQRLAQLEAQPARSASAPVPDRAIRIREACTRMGWSYSLMIKTWEKHGFFKDPIDGRIKIYESALRSPEVPPR
jgi:hypothetical protein